jgi:hypothetical protein
MRVGLVVAVAVVVGGCGESPLRGALRARERVWCEAVARCCAGAAMAMSVDECVAARMQSQAVRGELARDEGALRRGEATFDDGAVDGCIAAATKDWMSCNAPVGVTHELACGALVVGSGKAGDTCGYCAKGLVCVGATCRRVAKSGEDCGFLAVCEAGLTCTRGVCVAGLADGEECASGTDCASGRCETTGTVSKCAAQPAVSTVVCPAMGAS